jgi:hypothetical protein
VPLEGGCPCRQPRAITRLVRDRRTGHDGLNWEHDLAWADPHVPFRDGFCSHNCIIRELTGEDTPSVLEPRRSGTLGVAK